MKNGGCSHDCMNTDGGYVCSCNEGFEIGNDQHSCIGNFYIDAMLFILLKY